MSNSSRRALLVSMATGLSTLGGCLTSNQLSTNSDETRKTPSLTPTRSSNSIQTDTSTDTVIDTPTESPTTTPTKTPLERECDRQWNPRVHWSFKRGTEVFRPTVADGTIYFADQENHLYALAASSGKITWQIDRDTTSGVKPVVTDGVLTYKGYRTIAAYEATTGDERWTFEPPGNNTSLATEFGDDGDAVYLGVTNHSGLSISVENPYDRVYAFDRHTGEQMWKTTFSSSRDKQVPPRSVTAGGSRVFVTVGNHEGFLVALDASNGSELWRHRISRFLGPPVVAGGTVYQNSGTELVALDAASGKVRWRAGGEQPPGVSDGWVYCPKNSVLRAYHAADGQTRWEAEIPDGGFGGQPQPINGVVYLPSDRLYAFDPEKGCRFGSFDPESSVPTRPAANKNLVFTGGLKGAARMWAISAV